MDFEKLSPESKRAAFAHMDRKRLGTGARHKRLSAKGKKSVEHDGGATLSGKLAAPGSGSLKGRLSPADHDRGTVRGKLPVAKARPAAPKPAAKPSAPAEPDTPEARFDKLIADDVKRLTTGRIGNMAGLVDIRKTLDATGMSRAEQDKHLKRMSAENKINILQEDNRKTLQQEDHDAAIRLGGEDNHLISLRGADSGFDAGPAPTPPKAPAKPVTGGRLAKKHKAAKKKPPTSMEWPT